MKHLSIVIVLLAARLAAGQDMPLHEILKPGEDWKAHDGAMPSQAAAAKQLDLRAVPRQYIKELFGDPFKEPICAVRTLGGSTMLVADSADRYIWAFAIGPDGVVVAEKGDRYCRLRVRGDDRRKGSTPPEAYRADPSAMTVDAANRTYVATNLGIQVFDPTGRICGVFPVPGRVTEMAFDGDRLFARVGDKVFLRTMLATGSKD